MPIEQASSSTRAPRLFLRGESAVASIGIAAAAILLGAMAVLAWWNARAQRQTLFDARSEHVRAIGTLISQSAEAMLAADELSAIRRIISDAAVNEELAQCRLTLGDGQIVADADAGQINIHKLPEKWGGIESAATMQSTDRSVDAVFPVNVPGRGPARLEMTAKVSTPLMTLLQAQTSVGAVGAAALIGILAAYRHTRMRLRAMCAIHEALGAMARGETSAAVLQVSDELGPESHAWNKLLAEREKAKSEAASGQAAEVLGSRRAARGDLDVAFDAMAQGMLLIDDKLIVKHINGAAASFLRTKRDLAIGADVKLLIQQVDVLESLASVVGGSARKRTTIEVQREGDQGTGVLRFSIRPVRREDSAAAMLIIEDITQQKVAEESRNAFVAHATHELRTPLTNIRLYLETAMEDGEKDPAVRGKCLNVINQEARRLERIVGEMLSVSEIEAGSLRIKRDDVRLDALFEDLRADFQAQAAEKTITLVFNLPPKLPVINGDRDKMLLAMHNLVGNALKYTPVGGTVTVDVAADGKQLSFAVRDSGIGISADDAERIFERFYRAKDPRGDKITGTGLGLTLAREVVRLHGGEITVDSELNKGSTFTITLPVTAEAA
ncbi:phosphate regulon sensor histidine kinase PhoR [soil metagenome]